MREQFPQKKKGDSLSARHVNDLSAVAGRFARAVPGSHQHGYHGDTFFSTSPDAPWEQFTFEITNKKISPGDTEGSKFYLGRVRHYSESSAAWVTAGKEWRIDARGVDQTFEVGDYLIAYWDQQRGMFIPMKGGTAASIQVYFARLVEPLLCKQSAEARLYKSADPPSSDPVLSSEIVTVHDWFLPTGALDVNADVIIIYLAPYQRWYVTGTTCG